jgi:hypothetical protein
MKLHEASHRNPRFASRHISSKRPIQHPLRNLNDLARPDLYPDNRTTGPIFAAFIPKTAAVIWMPTIMKLYHLPDMGRMNM